MLSENVPGRANDTSIGNRHQPSIGSPNSYECHAIPSLYRSPGHHVDGGSLAEIFVDRSAIRWLRLYGRP
jgi:hypothetical protein